MALQKEINNTWSNVWNKEGGVTVEKLFTSRLFSEGYPLFRRYVPAQPKQFCEIGAGTGIYGLRFARDFPDSSVVITDIVDESLRAVQNFATELHLSNVMIKKEDASRLTFPDSLFDVVVSDAALQYFPEPEKAIREMLRILRPGGRLIVSHANLLNVPYTLTKLLQGKKYPYGNERSLTPAGMKRLFRRSGATIVAQEGFGVAYGFYRLRHKYPALGFLGRIVNRLSKIADHLTQRALSRYFGFFIVIIASKQ